MKTYKFLVLFVAAALLGLLLSSVQSVFAQTTEVCQRVTYPYGTYTQWSVTGQGCSSVGSTRVVPGSAPVSQPTAQPQPTSVPSGTGFVTQPTAVPAQSNAQPQGNTGNGNPNPVGPEVLGGACAVPYASSADGTLICSVQCGNIWRSSAGGCPTTGGSTSDVTTTVVNVVPVYEVGISYNCYPVGDEFRVVIFSDIAGTAIGKVESQLFKDPFNGVIEKNVGYNEALEYTLKSDPTGLMFQVIYEFLDGTQRVTSTSVSCYPNPSVSQTTIADQSVFVLTHECLPLHAHVITYLTTPGPVTKIEWNPSFINGWANGFYLSPTYTHVSGKLTFQDGSFLTASVSMNCPLPDLPPVVIQPTPVACGPTTYPCP